MNKGTIALLAILGFPVLVIVSAVMNGLALSILWGWFFVPAFDLPAISIVQAIGIALVIGYVTHQDCKGSDSEWYVGMFALIARPLLAIAYGWCFNLLMP